MIRWLGSAVRCASYADILAVVWSWHEQSQRGAQGCLVSPGDGCAAALVGQTSALLLGVRPTAACMTGRGRGLHMDGFSHPD